MNTAAHLAWCLLLAIPIGFGFLALMQPAAARPSDLDGGPDAE